MRGFISNCVFHTEYGQFILDTDLTKTAIDAVQYLLRRTTKTVICPSRAYYTGFHINIQFPRAHLLKKCNLMVYHFGGPFISPLSFYFDVLRDT